MLNRTRFARSLVLVLGVAVTLSGYVGTPDMQGGFEAELSPPGRLGGVEVADATLPNVGPVCNDQRVHIPVVKVFPLDHVSDQRPDRLPGDTDMAGHNTRIDITANVRREQSILIISGTVTMTEDQEDWSTFRSAYEKVISIAHLRAPGCLYHGVDLRGELRANGGDNNHMWTRYEGTDIIRAAQCLSDTRGDDAGKLGCRIFFRPIRLQALSPEEAQIRLRN